MKVAISSFYDTMGEDDGNIRHETPEEVEQVRFLNFFRLIQNIFLSLCENSTYLKVQFLRNIGLLLSNFRIWTDTFAFECFILFLYSFYLFSLLHTDCISSLHSLLGGGGGGIFLLTG